MKKILYAFLLVFLVSTSVFAIPPASDNLGSAVSSDIAALFSGVGDYLKSDGTKGTPGGTGTVTVTNPITGGHVAKFSADANSTTLEDGGVLGTMAAEAAANYVTKALFDVYTILMATADNTPLALSVTEQTIVGRATGGAIAALAIDSDLSSVSANDDTVPSAKATKAVTDALVTKALFDAYTVLMATADNTPLALSVTEETVVGRVTGGAIAALTLGVAPGNVMKAPADPTAHTLFGFDNTQNIYRPMVIGTGLSYDQASNTVTATSGTGTVTVTNPIAAGDVPQLADVNGTALTPSGLYADGDVIKLRVGKTISTGTVTVASDSIAMQTGTSAGDHMALAAYDTDTGPGYISLFRVLAGTTTYGYLGDETNYTRWDQSGNLVAGGTATWTAGGVVLGDTSPDADGEIGYASNHFNWFANSEDLVLTFGTDTATFSSNTGALVTITPDTTITGDLTVSGADITLAAAGVKLPGANGALTILGLGDGQDEDLKIDLNTTANTIEITSPASSAAAIDINTLNLVSTGTISGGMPRLGSWASPITSVGAYALAAANAYGMWIYYNDTDEITLPAAVAGMAVCVQVPAATLVPVGPNGTDVIVLDGTALSAGQAYSIAAVAGNFSCLIADAANHWVTGGGRGTLAAIP